MKFLTPLLCLLFAQGIAIAQEPVELSERRQGWETQRTEAQEKIDKIYFEELEQLKKNFVQAGKLPAARAVDIAIKGGEKVDNEPGALVKLSEARSKSLKKALKPLDKQYWQDLKKLREEFQKRGSLTGIDAADAEIKKVLAAYKKPEPPKKKAEFAKEKAEEKQADDFKGFGMELVVIGNPNNKADDTDYGSVPYTYRIGKYEVSEEMIAEYNQQNRKTPELAIALAVYRGANFPCRGVSWNEAARFVNWLNTSQGHHVAYKFVQTKHGDIEPWGTAEAWRLGGENLFRHKDAYYFLPSENEWYKAAYYDPNANNGEGAYWDYATGSNHPPKAVAYGNKAETAIYNHYPAKVDDAGGFSSFGTMAQGGNLFEMVETTNDGYNVVSTGLRTIRGGSWTEKAPELLRSDKRYPIETAQKKGYVGFRVASVLE